MLLDISCIGLGNGNAGSRLLVIRQVHVDDTGLVVAHHGGNGAQTNSHFRLLIEGSRATGAERNLTGYIDASIIFRGTNPCDEDVVHGGATAIFGSVQGDKRFVGIVGFVINEVLTGYGKATADGAVVVHRGNGKRIGVGTGRSAGVEVHIVAIERTSHRAAVLRPVAVVTGRNGDDRVGLCQGVQKALVGAVGGHTGVGGTQRQVHSVTAQHNGILNGNHVIGVIRTAAIAENLHDDQLGIRSIAHYADGICGRNIFLSPLQVAVCGCNACHVRTMLALGIIVVGHVQILVNVAEAKGRLQVYVQIRGRQARISLGSIQLRKRCGDFLFIQHINGLQILLVVHVGIAGILCQSHCQGQGIKGLMIGIQTSVDDGNPGACAGVAGLPGAVGPGHLSRNQHIGFCRSIGGGLLGLVPGLQNHVLDATDLLDLLNLPVGHIGGNQVGGQRQIPCHIQLFAQGLLDGCSHVCLLTLQASAVSHCRLVVCNVHGGEASVNGGRLLQQDGYPDHVCVGVFRSIRFLLRQALQQASGNCAVVHLPEADGCVAVCCIHRDGKAEQHRNHQQQGKQTGRQMHFLHTRSPFRIFAD